MTMSEKDVPPGASAEAPAAAVAMEAALRHLLALPGRVQALERRVALLDGRGGEGGNAASVPAGGDASARLAYLENKLCDCEARNAALVTLNRELLEKAGQGPGADAGAVQAAEAERQRLAAELAARDARIAELEQAAGSGAGAEALKAQLEAFGTLQKRLWPDCLRTDALRKFESEWSRQLASDEPDPRLLSMFAHIFMWKCTCEQLARGEEDAMQLEQSAVAALHSFSKCLFEWLYEAGVSADEAEQIYLSLSADINAELSAANAGYRICPDEVLIGDSYSTKCMVPSPRGASVGSVASILAWCIQNKAGSMCLRKALVILN